MIYLSEVWNLLLVFCTGTHVVRVGDKVLKELFSHHHCMQNVLAFDIFDLNSTSGPAAEQADEG